MRGWIVGFAALFICCSVVSAQPQRATERRTVPRIEANTPKTLDTFLPEADWNTEERGPLLAVLPKGEVQPRSTEPTFQGVDWWSKPLPPPEKGPRGYRLNTLGELFGYRLTPVGSLTVFAPSRMTVLNTRLPKPNPYLQMAPPERLQYFQSTLTPQQWRRFASAEGIGPSDLDARQKEVFDALLPNPLRLIRSTRRDDPNVPTVEEGVVLSPAERASVRLQMARKMDWFFRMGERGTYYAGIPPNSAHTPQVTLRVNGIMPVPPRETLFGAKVKEEVPARQKPGHLPFDWNGLDATVSLDNVATVGELIQRIRAATRLELYADRRYTDYRVFFRGTSARSGDVLRALALAVTGTYRKLGPAYILTDDIVGLGTRHAQIARWQRAAVIEAGALRVEMERAMKDVPLSDYIGWASDDPLAPTDALMARMDAHRKELLEKKLPAQSYLDFEKRNLTVPVSDMPPSIQGLIQEQSEFYQKSGGIFLRPGSTRPELKTDRVIVNVHYGLRFLIPGQGAVEAWPIMNRGGREFFPEPVFDFGPASAEPPAAVRLPQDKETRILTIEPKSANEATALIRAAKRCGFTAVWVQVGWEGKSLIEAAVKAGKSEGIPVGALVRVLRTNGKTTLPTDLNLLGETSVAYARRRLAEPPLPPETDDYPNEGRNRRIEFEDTARQGEWLRPDAPQVIAALLKHLKAIAEVPGLASLAVSDLSAPGYRCEYDTHSNKYKEEGWHVGYSEERRLAFLRERSVDPVDLSLFRDGLLPYYSFPRSSRGDLSLPLFPDFGPTGRYTNGRATRNGVDTYDMGPKDSLEKWLEYRLELKRQLVQTLVKQLKNGATPLPLYGRIGEDDRFTDYPAGFALLTTPEQAADCIARRPPPNGQYGMIESVEAIKTTTRQALHLAGYIPNPDIPVKTNFAQQTRRMFSPENRGWDGFVLDLTTISAADALAVLEAMPVADPGKP